MDESTQLVYVVVFLALWVLLVWRDVQRAQQIAAFLQRTRDRLVALSLAGTVLSGVGITMLLIGVYLSVTTEQGPGLAPGPRRTVALGAVMLMAGWLIRLVAWTLWKRRREQGQ